MTVLTTESKYATAELGAGGSAGATMQAMVAGHLHDMARLAGEHAATVASPTAQAMTIIAQSLSDDGKVLACGNGGSASDAQHLVGELIGRVSFERHALPAVSLTSDSSVVTAIANDYGYEEVFARQVRGLGREGDVLVAMSTSGRSKNVIKAVAAARQLGMHVVSMTGPSADTTLELSNVWIRIESPETTHIQEIHGALIHTICLGVERIMHLQRSPGDNDD